MISKKLSQKDFEKSFRYAPRVALNILVKNSNGQILLTKRAIEPERGSWHYPGGFILKNETINNCFERISTKELGVKLDFKKSKLLGVFENINGDARGHILDLIYEYKFTKSIVFKSTKETSEIKNFKKLPAKIGFSQRDILNKLSFN
ncbi:MAG: NUDIX domain-containing protein [Nanoarchaeota archaeon]